MANILKLSYDDYLDTSYFVFLLRLQIFCVSRYTGGSQRATSENWFFPSTLQVLDMKPRSSGLVVCVLSVVPSLCQPSHLSLCFDPEKTIIIRTVHQSASVLRWG